MEIFSGQNFSFSSFLSVETLIKWVNFGDGSLPTVPKVLESSNGNFPFLVFDWFSPQTIEFSPLNTEDFQAFPHSANSTKKSESKNKFSLERFFNKNVKEEGTALTPKNKVSNIATLFLVSKTCVLNSHIREKLADQGRLTKGTPPRSTPYCTTNQFFRTTLVKF